MSETKWRSPFENWDEKNQDPNLAFTLVARNERARKMWKDAHNSPKYVRGSFAKKPTMIQSVRGIDPNRQGFESDEAQPRPEEKKDSEPALTFLFNDWPKDSTKGYVLGSDAESCDALVGVSGDVIDQQMLAFTFNEDYEVVMNVTSLHPTYVTFNDHKEAKRGTFSWIFPRNQKAVRVMAAGVLEFDVVLPKYGINDAKFRENCDLFLFSAKFQNDLEEGSDIDNLAATEGTGGISNPEATEETSGTSNPEATEETSGTSNPEATEETSGTSNPEATEETRSTSNPEATEETSGISDPEDPFYLRVENLGSGSYGEVFKVLRMPDGKTFAAKRFKMENSFKKEVDILKKVCEKEHKYIVQYVEEWHGDYMPLLVMEYVAGGNLEEQRTEAGITFSQIAKLAEQMLSALVFLHDQSIVHRDIKPANILCVTPDHYKLADFGVAREMAPLLSKQGTPAYMAPEVDESSPYGEPADVWSLGVILFECMNRLPNWNPSFGQWEWAEKILNRLTGYLSRCERSREMTNSGATGLVVFVQTAMLQLMPSQRLSAPKCLEEFPKQWAAVGQNLESSVGSGSKTPAQAHPYESFPPAPAGDSDEDEAEEDDEKEAKEDEEAVEEEAEEEESTSDTLRKPRSEDATAKQARTGVPSGISTAEGPSAAEGPPAAEEPSTAEGELYDPAHEFTSLPSNSDEETPAEDEETPVADGNAKRRRKTLSSAGSDELRPKDAPSSAGPSSSKHDGKRKKRTTQ